MNGFEAGLEIAYQWGSTGLELAVVAAGYAALLAMAVALTNVLFRRWLSAGQLGLLWGLVLVRLMLPIAPESSLSLQNLSRAVPAVEAATPPATPASAAVFDALDPPQGPYSAGWQAPTPSLAEQAGQWFVELLPLVWIAGAVAVVSWTTIVNWRFSRRARRTPVCRDERLLRLWSGCCRQAGVASSIGVLRFDGVAQPAIMGLFRPRLLLPSTATDLDDEQLRMVMLHELAHVRRCDIAVNWLLVVVRAAHWWNPIYWLAAARFASLREQACDAFVLQRLDSSTSRVYCELLLLFAERGPTAGRWRVMLPVSILGVLPSLFRHRALHNRLRALQTADRPRGSWHTVAAGLAIALAACCGLTDAKTQPQAEPTDWLPAATVDRVVPPVALVPAVGPDETRVYEIDKVLERIATDGGTIEYAWMQLGPLIGDLLQRQAPTLSVRSPAPVAAESMPDALQPERAQDRYRLEGGKLTVVAPREVHEELARDLATWEQSGLGQISIWCRFISGLPIGVALEMGLTWRYLNAASPAVEQRDLIDDAHDETPVVRASAVVNDYFPVAVATLDPAKTARLVNAAQGDRRTNVLQGPRITLFSGSRAHLNDYSQTPFVVGVREVTPGVQEPNIVVVDEGTKLAVRATHTADRNRVRLAARVELSHIGEVRTAALSLGAETGAIQLPRVRRCSIDVASEVKSGDSVLIGCMSSYEDKRFMYVLLTVQDVTETEKATK